jgi:RNA polymerase sigma factor (sigma-70 family)
VARSLDEPVGDQETALGELIADEHVVDPAETALRSERDRDVSAMLRMLPERHRQVIERRYGLDGARVQSHKEIGASLGVGEERSRQLEHEALRRLREVAEPARNAA